MSYQKKHVPPQPPKYSLPVMPFQSGICKAAPYREDLFSTSLAGRKQQLPRASPRGAPKRLQECPYLAARTWTCKDRKASLPQQKQISAASSVPYQALCGSGKLFGSNLTHISSQEAASLSKQPALFLILIRFLLFLPMASH